MGSKKRHHEELAEREEDEELAEREEDKELAEREEDEELTEHEEDEAEDGAAGEQMLGGRCHGDEELPPDTAEDERPDERRHGAEPCRVRWLEAARAHCLHVEVGNEDDQHDEDERQDEGRPRGDGGLRREEGGRSAG